MKKKTKAFMIVALTSLLAVGVAAPVFRNVKIEDIDIKGKQTSIVEATGEGFIDDTEEINEVTTENQATSNDADKKDTAADSEVTEYKYMKKIPEDAFHPIDEYYDWSTASGDIYAAQPDDYTDPELKRLAEKYISQGYYLTDEEFIFENFGDIHYVSCIGIKDYAFVDGFEVVDKRGGDNTISISVLKCTQEEFDLFIDAYFDDDDEEEYELKEDGNTITIEYGCYTLTYNKDTEVFIYHADLSGEGVG